MMAILESFDAAGRRVAAGCGRHSLMELVALGLAT